MRTISISKAGRACAIFSSLLVFILGRPSIAHGQGKIADYKRSAGLSDSTFGKIIHRQVFPHWTKDGSAFWYVDINPDATRDYWWVDASRGTRKPAFDHARLSAALAKAQLAVCDPKLLDIAGIDHDSNGNLLLKGFGFEFALDLNTYDLTAVKPLPIPTTPLPQLDAIPRSDVEYFGHDRAIVRFHNRTGKTMWMQAYSRGNKPGWVMVPSGWFGNVNQVCYSGQIYVSYDQQGQWFGIYQVEGDGGDIVIDPPATTKPTSIPSTAPATQPAAQPGRSPDGRWAAFIKNHNLMLHDNQGGPDLQLSTDGKESVEYVPPGQGGVFWAPDSLKLAILEDTTAGVRRRYWVQSSPPDQLNPKLETSTEYPPGAAATRRIKLFDVRARRAIPIKQNLLEPAWGLGDVRWDADSRHLSFVFNAHTRDLWRLLDVDAATGAAATLIEDRNSTFISPDNFWMAYPSARDILYASERSGWNQLYLCDRSSGEPNRQITRGCWVFRSIYSIDPLRRTAWFWASGVDPKQDPYYQHLCRINLDGSGFLDMTPADGTHEIRTGGENNPYYLDSYSRVDLPPVIEIRRWQDGTLACTVEHASADPLLKTGWKYPERFVAKGRDGATDIYGVIYRPTHFDPAGHYPVVEDIYTGPQGASVPKAFTPYCYPMSVAELGFIVVQIDGMGTNFRGKAFHDVCWHNLADSGFPDRIAWIKAAAAAHPEMDLSRVGLYGYSAGGYSAVRALEDHGDFYKTAVAINGLHDLRLYRNDWSEQYMGWPVGRWYQQEANTDPAAVSRISGHLEMIVSEMDHNVDPANTTRMVNALIKADKDFDFLEVPNADHWITDPYADRRIKDFLVRHLLGVEPRSS